MNLSQQLKKSIINDTCLIYGIKRPISTIISEIAEMETLREKFETSNATNILTEIDKQIDNLNKELEESKEFYSEGLLRRR